MSETITSARVRELGAAATGQTHNIKCWPEPFEEMLAGRKTAEFRLNDRGYCVGDKLLIREWCPDSQAYTHREIERVITHILSAGFGLPQGYVMLSLAKSPNRTSPTGSVKSFRVRNSTSSPTWRPSGRSACLK